MSLSFDSYHGHSPVYSNFNEYKGDANSDTNLNYSENSNDLSAKINDNSLVELTLNLERERETYLEAVAVLHDQLRESHEQCQQLVNSHAELTRELEAEVDDGWKEAKHWQDKYYKSCRIMKAAGIDVNKYPNLSVVGSPENEATNISSVSTNVNELNDYPAENFNGTWVYTLSDNFEDLETLANIHSLSNNNFPLTEAEAKMREKVKNAWINLKTPRRFSNQYHVPEYMRESNSEPLSKILELLKYVDY
ncbi:uncharacterized protein TA13345 [Theileria annulata]|uniref:Uncharacterized protein n=1 Tax=Theileria annulata TaxID=5874 RepID=Q4UEH3_THEAN|nr:uncharacterized protein TA13345 [Theileria annulata]CAI74516.1 hypothetical protein TA13345 [Theileria annulata]|eukprot:XP_952248.1 hypothetical protein TA13345 [Theileria annulata]